jgi:phosphatidylglycerol lysyltransferase
MEVALQTSVAARLTTEISTLERSAALPPAVAPGLLEEYAFRYGRTYDAYLVTEPGWEGLPLGNGQGMVAVARRGRYLFTSGGLLAPQEHHESLLAEYVERAAARNQVLTFFNVAEEQLPLFRRFGFQATKWGEEALVDLPQCTWSGKPYEWVRRQTNYCRRQGLVVSECRRDCVPAVEWHAVMSDVCAVSAAFLAGKPQSGEMRFLQARFDPQRLGRKRLFLARSEDGAGRIEGFLACNPTAAGRLWSIETYRQRGDAVRGTLPFLIHQVMEVLKHEGVEGVSLCLIPGLRCREALPGDSALVRLAMVLGAERFSLLFDTAGAYHFKSRFRPRFENRYLCVRPRMTLGVGWAFIQLLGVLRLDVGKFCRSMRNRWQKRASRATLWTPDDEVRETVPHAA